MLPDTGGRQGELETEPIFAKRLEGLVAEARYSRTPRPIDKCSRCVCGSRMRLNRRAGDRDPRCADVDRGYPLVASCRRRVVATARRTRLANLRAPRPPRHARLPE